MVYLFIIFYFCVGSNAVISIMMLFLKQLASYTIKKLKNKVILNLKQYYCMRYYVHDP